MLDRIPYAESEEITVERLPETTPPTAENVDDRRGVVAWTYTYKPGQIAQYESAYRLRQLRIITKSGLVVVRPNKLICSGFRYGVEGRRSVA